MSMLKIMGLILAGILAIVCPVLAIPLVAIIWVVIDRHRAKVAEAKRCRSVFIQYASDQERYKAARSL